MEPIREFKGEFRFLSNFWPAEVNFDGMRFPTVEHAYQAAKTLDMKERETIMKLPSPKQAKRYARMVRKNPKFDDAQRLKVMRQLVMQKFTRHEDLRQQLLATGDAQIVEGNSWGDTFWGVCAGKGSNHLGTILMEVRAALERYETAV